MLFWRGLFAGLMILCIIIVQERRHTLAAFRAIGCPASRRAVLDRRHDPVPQCVATHVGGRCRGDLRGGAIRHRRSRLAVAWHLGGVDTLVASFVALLGVSVMVGGAVAEGHLVGDLLAFGMTVCMAVMMLILRQQHATPMSPPPACRRSFVRAGVAVHVAVRGERRETCAILLFGTTQFGLGLVLLLTLGGQLVSATENALFNTLETPLAIAWVWLCFNEIPSIAASSAASS